MAVVIRPGHHHLAVAAADGPDPGRAASAGTAVFGGPADSCVLSFRATNNQSVFHSRIYPLVLLLRTPWPDIPLQSGRIRGDPAWRRRLTHFTKRECHLCRYRTPEFTVRTLEQITMGLHGIRHFRTKSTPLALGAGSCLPESLPYPCTNCAQDASPFIHPRAPRGHDRCRRASAQPGTWHSPPGSLSIPVQPDTPPSPAMRW